MSKVVFKQANAENVKKFYGDKPIKSFRGFVAEIEDRVIGVGGVFFNGESMVAFSEMKPEMRKYKRDIARGVRLLEHFFNNLGYNVVAFASKEEPTAKKLLTKLGFVGTGLMDEQGELLIRSTKWQS